MYIEYIIYKGVDALCVGRNCLQVACAAIRSWDIACNTKVDTSQVSRHGKNLIQDGADQVSLTFESSGMIKCRVQTTSETNQPQQHSHQSESCTCGRSMPHMKPHAANALVSMQKGCMCIIGKCQWHPAKCKNPHGHMHELGGQECKTQALGQMKVRTEHSNRWKNVRRV